MMFEEMVVGLKKLGDVIVVDMIVNKVDMLYMVVGIVGEVGEFIDVVKKYVVYNKLFDCDNVVEEFGDIEFYFEGLW